MSTVCSDRFVTSSPRSFCLQEACLPVAEQMFRTRRLRGRDGNHHRLDVFVPELQGQLLYSLTRFIEPMRSVEIGMANGVSTLYIAQGLRDNARGSHIAIDPFQSIDWQEAGLVALEQAQLRDLVTLHEEMSHHALPRLEREGTRIQMAFVDGSHLFDYVISDVLNLDRLLDVGGLMVFDDSDWPAINAAIRFMLGNLAYEVFPTGVIIEPPPYRPSFAGRLLRTVGRRVPKLGNRLRPEFLHPPQELGISGRCVVLRKVAEDKRDNQGRQFAPF